jgi:hypothetical protein
MFGAAVVGGWLLRPSPATTRPVEPTGEEAIDRPPHEALVAPRSSKTRARTRDLPFRRSDAQDATADKQFGGVP